MLGGAGVYATLGSPTDLAEKLLLVLEHPPLAAQLAAAVRARAVQEFAWYHAAPELEAIYARVLARGGQPVPRYSDT